MDKLIKILKEKKLKISVAESCTGGLFMSMLTDIPGASEVFESGFVTYSDRSKFTILGVSPHTISVHGAVSEETVREMLDGLAAETGSDVLCAVSGIAGPGGGTPQKPVGTVYAGFRIRKGGMTGIKKYSFAGTRISIKDQTVNAMCEELKRILKEN